MSAPRSEENDNKSSSFHNVVVFIVNEEDNFTKHKQKPFFIS